MTSILVAADGQWVRDLVRAAFAGPGQEVFEVTRGQEVRTAFAQYDPHLVVLDMQIGNMGGIACAIDLRLEESGGRLGRATILLLLDREADRFLASRADADGMLVKPVDAGTLRRAGRRLLEEAAERAAAEAVEEREGATPIEAHAAGEDADDTEAEAS